MVRYVAPILPHVHFRGEEYKDVKPSFLELGCRDARAVGAVAFVEQPNTKPALTEINLIRQRGEMALSYTQGLIHRVHIGLTNDLEQVRRAFNLAKSRLKDIYSVKAFWTHSTGNMGLLDKDLQREIWKIAGSRELDYRGVFFQHLEDEEKYTGDFDFKNPVSHSLKQNEYAETFSAETQIRNAFDADFKGFFYAAHVSSPETVDFLNSERDRVPFKIVIETTAHHEFLNFEDYVIHKNRVKMNPPLRSVGSQRRLLEKVVDGKTDILGDDHAPHPLMGKNGKDSENPASGIPAIAFLPKRIELLQKLGINEAHLNDLLFNEARFLFGIPLNMHFVDVEYNPSLWDDYGYNPFLRVDGTIK